MSLNDDIQQAIENGAHIETHQLRRQRDQLTNQNTRLIEENTTLRKALALVDLAENQTLQPPTWMSPAKPKNSAATLVAMLSDTHYDEIVNPDEMEGLNAYNRDIATTRTQLWSQNVIKLARHHLAGVNYDGMVLMLGGDIFSGDIHEELSITNEDTMIGSLLYWSEQIAASIDLFVSEFKKIHVVAVVGNHGRTTRKPRMKQRVRTNFDWLLAKMVERHFASNRHVTFTIPESADAWLQIYNHGHLVTHGDQVNGGGGIGGIYPPIMRMRAKKQSRYLATGKSFQTIWLGHWHQYISTPSMVVNGSMKGFDEYALLNGFSFEQPQQAFALVTPKHNLTFQAPVFCADRKKEGW